MNIPKEVIRNIPKADDWVYTIDQHWITGAYIDERIYRSNFKDDSEFHLFVKRVEEAKKAAILNVTISKWANRQDISTRKLSKREKYEAYLEWHERDKDLFPYTF